MIPVRLKLRNFMCYRDNVPPLDFTGIHLACLSGDNGNGKSAIIDAVTWALWGKARATSDDDLIHGSLPEMEVEFDFSIGRQLYRIIRKRARPKKKSGAGQSSLEFQVGAADGFRPITGNTIAQTQQKIIETLHMDYDTFINSAYLRQGHADEFTTRKPAERKEVLGNILGLNRYDELEDRARAQAKQFEADAALAAGTIADVDIELARKPEYEAELAQAQNTLAAAEAAVKEKEAILNGLRGQKEALEMRRTQQAELEIRLANSARDLLRWQEQADQHRARIVKYEEVISRCEAIAESYARFIEAKASVEKFDKRYRQSNNLKEQKMKLERTIDNAGNELTTEHTATQREINRLENKAQTLPALKEQLAQVQTRRLKTADAETALQQKERAALEAQRQVNFLESERAGLEKEISEAGEKLDLIASQIASHAAARCPLCDSELTPEGLQLIAAKYTAEKQAKTAQFRADENKLAEGREAYRALTREKAQAEAALEQEKLYLKGQEETLKTRVREIEDDVVKQAELKSALDGVEQRLARRDFALAEQQALGAIEMELAALGYDAAAHEAAQRQLQELEACERDKNTLDEAMRLIDQEKEAAARAGEAAGSLREVMAADNRKKEALSAELTRLPQVIQELAAAEAEHKALAGQRSQAQETLGSVRAKIQRLTELEIKKQEKEQQMAQSAREEAIYKELARAFGKSGIQAWLIGEVLPDIEMEANRLLALMTDNRMTIKFEMQKPTRAGNIKETLDIVIADELGTRNYEMFSGGEAFRINFAVRIALSRLLARRGGAPLPTLIIDEGFGTQDASGLERLKEAIISIQTEFEKILVITHLEELKDSFPARIEVTKTPEGSTINVN